MRTSSLLIGLTLCIAGVGGAAATSLSTDTLENGSHVSGDSSATGLMEGGGDALGVGHDNAPPDNSSGRSDSGTSPSPSQRGSGSAAPATPTRRSPMSWQSLLPGSIQ